MADTYAVVQKRGAPARTGSGPGAQGTEGTPLYSQVMPSARRPQAPAEDARGALPCRGESAWRRAGRASSYLLLLGTPILRDLRPPGRPGHRPGLLPAGWSRPEVSRSKPWARGWVRFSRDATSSGWRSWTWRRPECTPLRMGSAPCPQPALSDLMEVFALG